MKKPEITGDMIQKTYALLMKMHVPLDADPLLAGPGRLNEKIAQTRHMLDRVERILNLWTQYSHWYKKAFKTESLAVDLERDYLMAENPEVRAGRNLKTMMASANMLLRERIRGLNELETTIEDIEHVLKVIESKKADLKDTQQRIKDQYRICQDEIGIGGRWGHRSRRLSEMPVPEPRAVLKQPSSLDEILDGMHTKTHLSEEDYQEAPPEKAVEAEPEPQIRPNEVDFFLNSLPDHVEDSDGGEEDSAPDLDARLDAMLGDLS